MKKNETPLQCTYSNILLFSFNRGGNFQNFSLNKFPIGKGVQYIMAAKYWTPDWFLFPLGKRFKIWWPQNEKLKILWLPNIESPLIFNSDVNWWEMLLANYKISLLFLLIVIDGMWYHNKCWALEILNSRDLIQINQIMELSTLHKS